jgi:hypothetical protein
LLSLFSEIQLRFWFWTRIFYCLSHLLSLNNKQLKILKSFFFESYSCRSLLAGEPAIQSGNKILLYPNTL